jgi:hypothetical protein
MKDGVINRARDSLTPSITSGYGGGSFGFRRAIVVDWRQFLGEDERDMEEGSTGFL